MIAIKCWFKLYQTAKISHFPKGKLTCSGAEIPEYELSRMNKRKNSKYPNFIFEDMYHIYTQQIVPLSLVVEELAEST